MCISQQGRRACRQLTEWRRKDVSLGTLSKSGPFGNHGSDQPGGNPWSVHLSAPSSSQIRCIASSVPPYPLLGVTAICRTSDRTKGKASFWTSAGLHLKQEDWSARELYILYCVLTHITSVIPFNLTKLIVNHAIANAPALQKVFFLTPIKVVLFTRFFP